MPDHPLEPLATLPGVAAAVDAARVACEELRWHRALRRSWPVARTEAGVRSAHAGAALDGVRIPLDLVRDVARGAVGPPPGAMGQVLVANLRAHAEVERLMGPPGATRPAAVPFGQLVSRLHAVGHGAAGGRPRTTEEPSDLRGLGTAVAGAELGERLAALAHLVATPLPPTVPALLLAAVVHGELMTLRPYARGNGLVARATFRHLVTRGGVDPVGVVVAESAWTADPNVHLGAAAGYAAGAAPGVAGWARHCAAAVVAGAAEGRRIADAVLAGRLAPQD